MERVRDAHAVMKPIHQMLRVGDANPVTGVLYAIDMWGAAEKASCEAIAKTSFPDAVKTDMVASLQAAFKRRFDIWCGTYHKAGHLLRPKFLLEGSLESVDPTCLAALESYFDEFYSFPEAQAKVSGVDGPARRAFQTWKNLVEKAGIWSLMDGEGRHRKIWSEAGKCSADISTYEWYSMRFFDNTQETLVLYLPAKWLCASRMSESQSEREFSIAGAVSGGRPGLRVDKHELLSHIYWAAHCQAGSHAESSESESAGSDAGDDAGADDLEDVEQELGAVTEVIVGSPFEELAKLALDDVRMCIASLRPASEGGPLRGPAAALPLLDTLMDCAVTQRSLGRLGSEPMRAVKAYQSHDNKEVALAAKMLMSAWRAMFRDDTCKHATARASLA